MTRLNDQGNGVRFPVATRELNLLQRNLRAHPASYSMVTAALSLGVKKLSCEAYPSLPHNGQLKDT